MASTSFPLRLRLLPLAATLGLTLVAHRTAAAEAAPRPPVTPTATTGEHPGWTRARVICSSCHLAPEPSLLTRPIWKDFILQKMSFYTGVQQLDVARNEEGDLFKASGLFPSVAMLTKAEYAQIEDYYLKNAPEEKLSEIAPRPAIQVGLKRFALDPPRFRSPPPLTTLVSIDAAEQRIYLGDANDQTLKILDAQSVLLETVEVGNIPVWMSKKGSAIYLACIGHFFPKEERRGQLIRFERKGASWERREILSSLPRPCHIDFADLNGDGKQDALVSMFGYLTGRFSWIEGMDTPSPREHILLGKAGALVAAAHDFDNDGHPDVGLLSGQELESFVIYFGDGQGRFDRTRKVFQQPPSFGHTYFELADFNRDRIPDLVVCNGDNGDYESPAKPYHGIRIFLGKGGGEFAEPHFIPIHGAFRALARDFDEDQDLDLAVISFYPDYEHNPRESFIYLENKGDLNFEAFTFRECIAGRWMVMDAGDLDGDRDLDIVLGSMIRMPSKVPDFVRDAWETAGPSVVVLRNTLR